MTKKEIISLNLERYEMLTKIQRAKDPNVEIQRQMEAVKKELEAKGIAVDNLELK